LRKDRAMLDDLEKLGNACCQPQRIVALQGAPVPTRV